MDKAELNLLKKAKSGSITQDQLVQLFYQYQKNYRVVLNLISNPKFPVKQSLDVIPRLYTMDLLRLVRNMNANPFIRQKAELEFLAKYPKLPLGEKINYLKIAPASLLRKLLNEEDLKALTTMINNVNCTADVILEHINRRSRRINLYRVLAGSSWIRNARIIEAILHDPEAPVRILVAMVPFLTGKKIRQLAQNHDIHPSVKRYIKGFLAKKG